jgi:hypothetical protein
MKEWKGGARVPSMDVFLSHTTVDDCLLFSPYISQLLVARKEKEIFELESRCALWEDGPAGQSGSLSKE